MKIISTEIDSIVKYGIIKIETRVGVLEYSFQVGGDGTDYELVSVLSNYHDLTIKELGEIDDYIMEEINKLR